MTPEGRVKNKLKAALDKHFPGHYRFMPVQTGYGARTLDFLLCISGRFIAIETKAQGKALTPLQATTAGEIVAAGGLAFCVDNEFMIDNVIARIHLELEFNGRGHHQAELRAQAQAQGQQHLRE